MSPIAITVPSSGGGTGGVNPPVTPKVAGVRERWIWISPAGTQRELTNFVNGTEVVKGLVGRFKRPVVIQTDVIPGQPGARIRDIHHDVYEIDLPLFATGTDHWDMYATLSAIVREMDTVIANGILRNIDLDGNTSDLYCRCTDLGMEAEGNTGPVGNSSTLIFQAHDPYWYGEPIISTWTDGSPQSWFNILPLSLGSSAVLGDVVITNQGDVPAWPIWTINGPGSNPITIANNSTGEVIQINKDLLASQQVIIDTRPGFKTVTGPANASWRKYMTQRSLWGLAAGRNEVTLAVAGSTSASFISMNYRPALLVPGLPAPVQRTRQ